MNNLEKNRIRKYLQKANLDNINDAHENQIFNSLIVIVNTELHDSGFPCIEIYGISEDQKTLFSLGKYHDHYICSCRVNVDAFGKNVFHIMPRGKQHFFVAKPYFCSTFEITENYELR